MRHGMPLAIPWLVVVVGFLPAQERIVLPAPDPVSPELLPVPSPSGSSQTPEPPNGPPEPYVPPPSSELAPPPTTYAPPPPNTLYPPPPELGPLPNPPPYFLPNPVTNPSFWIGVEALAWWTKNQPMSVPLVTTGPASEGGNAGNLGMPGTTSLDSPLHYGVTAGIGVYGGGWFTPTHTFGVDASLFILGQQSAGFTVVDRSGVGNLVINEPVSGAPFYTQVSAPGIESGSVAVGSTSTFGGGDINLLYNLYRARGLTINLLGGYRYLQLDDSLNITANSNLFVSTTYTDNMGNTLAYAPPGSTVTMVDYFGTRNQFNGGQIGTSFWYQRRRLFLGGAAKVAFGDTYSEVSVNGTTTVFPVNGSPVQMSGGNYATLQIGQYAINHFAVAPQGQLKIGYQFAPCIRGMIGYDFIFLSSVLRPGNQIDNTYDGMMHPLVPMTTSSYWAQGLTMSVQFSF